MARTPIPLSRRDLTSRERIPTPTPGWATIKVKAKNRDEAISEATRLTPVGVGRIVMLGTKDGEAIWEVDTRAFSRHPESEKDLIPDMVLVIDRTES